MTEAVAKPRWRKWARYLLFAVACVLLALGGLAWYATTDSFQTMVRSRFVAEVERVTGGRVQVGGLHTVPFRFLIDIRDLTIRGREAESDAPYVHVDRVVAHVHVISILSKEFGFSSIVFERPAIHLIVYPDGTTNQPEPKVEAVSKQDPIAQLFSLSVDNVELRHGELLWNDQHIPLDFTVNDVSANMAYSLLHHHYQGDLLLGKVETRVQDYKPFSWMLETHFVLGPGALEVKSLKWTSGRSRLDASGRIDDFRRPKIEATYVAKVDLAEAAAIARRRDLRGGILEANGKGTWSLDQFTATGKLLLRDFEWRDDQINLRNASLNSQFSVTPQRLTLTQLQARVLGGTATGDADVSNWLAPPPSGKSVKTQKRPDQKGTIHLRLKDMSLAAMAEAFSTRDLPLAQIKPVGTAAGTLEARWQGAPRNADVDIALDVVPPSNAAREQLPLTSRVRASYHGSTRSLEVSDLTLSSRATQIRASGNLSSTTSLKVSATSSDVGELQPLIASFHGPAPLPVKLHGHAAFNGTASGNLSNIALVGNLQADNFDSLVPATSASSAKQVHWDSLNTNLQLSPQHFAARNGVLRHSDTRLGFDLSASLHDGRFLSQDQFTLHLNIHNADVGELQSLAGSNYPVSGRLNLVLQAGGTRSDPRGDGHMVIHNAVVYGEPLERFTSDVRLGQGEGQLNNIEIVHYNGRIAGAAAYNPTARTFHFNLNGSGFDLARMAPLQVTRVAVDGRMDFTARGSGTVDEPSINANIQLHDLAFDHERAGNFTFDATTQGADMHLSGRSEFNQAELAIDGDIHLRQDWPADITLRFSHLDGDALLRTYLRGKVTGHSAFDGDLRLRGPLRQLRQVDVFGNLSQLYVDLDNIKLRNDGPVRFAMSNQVVDVQQLRLVGDGTDLSASGKVHLAGSRELDLRAEGKLNLQLIQTLDPQFTTSGEVTVSGTVTGTIAQPVAQGRLEITNGAVAYADLPSSLSGINGTLLFNQNRLQVESLTAHSGGGLVTLGGDVTRYNGQFNFNLTAHAEEVRLRYPPGISSTANADLRLSGNDSAAILSGDLTVTKLAMTPGFDFGLYLARSKQSVIMPQTNTYLNRVRLDVHLTTTPELQMQTAVAKLSGDADLHLRGSIARPSVLGRVDILEGEIYFNGTKYRLERGDISFSNPVSITPVIDLQATTQIRDYDITVNLNGQLDKLRAKWRSEPPLPEADIIALLALGRTQEESAQLQASGRSSFGQDTSNAILGEALNATVSNRAQRLFGVSRIKIDPQGLSSETNPNRGPQVTIEQQVADKLTLTYSTNVSQASQQIIQVEYNVSRNVSIVGVRDQNGVVSFDVRIRQRKK